MQVLSTPEGLLRPGQHTAQNTHVQLPYASLEARRRAALTVPAQHTKGQR